MDNIKTIVNSVDKSTTLAELLPNFTEKEKAEIVSYAQYMKMRRASGRGGVTLQIKENQDPASNH